MRWLVYRSKTIRCCRTATDDEIAEDPDAYQCAGCEWTARVEALWPENRDAWQLYQTLCGRTVGSLTLHGWVLGEWFREEPTFGAKAEMLQRLDVIGDEFDRHGQGRGTHDDGRSAESEHRPPV